jgi:hypothetical protein
MAALNEEKDRGLLDVLDPTALGYKIMKETLSADKIKESI